MESINYAGGANMTLPADAQFVQGVSGNALYLPAGFGKVNIAGDRNELTISLWRQWDGVVEADDYRGVFATANIKVYFDQGTDLLTVELEDTKKVTDIKDDQEQTHWCFLFAKNSFFKIYKNAELRAELTAGNDPVDFSEGLKLGGGRTHATFDEFRFYKKVVTEPEIRGLYFLITKGTPVQQLENIIANNTPRYLGVVETVPSTRTAIITKGEKLGAVDANPGDWVLSGKTIGGWKVGVCYKWTGAQWINLEPEVNYAEAYQACLVHMFEIEELKQQTGHYGALFAKVLVAQKAMIDELLVNQAFIKNLVVQKLKIDTDDTTNQDFEAWFDELNGLKIRNKGEEIFKIDTNGDIYIKGATVTANKLIAPTLTEDPQNAVFGEIWFRKGI
ncbi:LamG domain-containing protein [Treponema sp. OMZ 799]|uniref:LamG domain-containing protein n=1 Tax=Treponema sp. OMZ 799 TaxID=2563668 RepID=UPI0020A281C9|nr:LamG domain-containing protein [Treponema sp. OMZ 799]UTC77562.1 LamG domain-containing protein [Treponema sp. OMZ 799]